MLNEVVTCNCVQKPGWHAESNLRPSEEGVSFELVLRPLDMWENGDGWLVCVGQSLLLVSVCWTEEEE